jgi:hypothetical protein
VNTKLFLIKLSFLLTINVNACLGVSSLDRPVKMLGQTNLIVWDKENGIEHFIRDAAFDTKAEKTGFIAPTPSVPKITEADATLFTELQNWIDPFKLQSISKSGGAGMGGSTGINIIQSGVVAGFTVVTVSANDTNQLMAWMKENKFVHDNDFRPWVDFYVKKRWFLTLFKVEKSKDSSSFNTGNVCMSFRTQSPYNPYYVPKSNLNNGQILNLFFVADEDYDGRIGAKTFWSTDRYSMNLSQRQFYQLKQLTGLPKLKMNHPKMINFVDNKFATGATEDLFFFTL